MPHLPGPGHGDDEALRERPPNRPTITALTSITKARFPFPLEGLLSTHAGHLVVEVPCTGDQAAIVFFLGALDVRPVVTHVKF